MESLVLSGGLVLDPAARTFVPKDVRVADGRIVEHAPPGRVIDVSGLLVAPGLVDLHSHVFVGQDLGLDADTIGPAAGTTTFIDTGSAGAHLVDAFRRTSIDGRRLRVKAFLNIATVGATSILLSGELMTLAYCDERAAIEAAQRHRDVIVGVKVRASFDVGGLDGPGEALARGRRVADAVDLPLMVHLGPAPVGVDDIVATLRAGDVLTHCCTGFAGNQVVQDGRVRPAVRAAHERGVILDVGHGMSGFDASVARVMIDDGLPPDTISSDLHTYSRPVVGGLPDVLSKFLALGLSEADVLARATLAPARVVGLDTAGVGTLRPGAPADVVVFRVVRQARPLTDGHGNVFTGDRHLEPVLTIAGGELVYERLDPR